MRDPEIALSERVDRRYDVSDEEPLSCAIATAVGNASDQDPTDLEPLGDYVNVNALNQLFDGAAESNRRTGGHVAFRYGDREVLVTDDGVVLVAGSE
ncbi:MULTISPECIES: HalOD1 output domain-containing protein [Halorussus]|uniref:HalOD1 output domain-containing protein n=1 Tax=Halorussus TaxID=1070314 RepID=UPI00209D6ECF|nr:HalOD1 output domain-containing protein [Halorussus vallis]USZ76337.1 hypothetical protein NGM07_03175 [Halorussus vallis]